MLPSGATTNTDLGTTIDSSDQCLYLYEDSQWIPAITVKAMLPFSKPTTVNTTLLFRLAFLLTPEWGNKHLQHYLIISSQ